MEAVFLPPKCKRARRLSLQQGHPGRCHSAVALDVRCRCFTFNPSSSIKQPNNKKTGKTARQWPQSTKPRRLFVSSGTQSKKGAVEHLKPAEQLPRSSNTESLDKTLCCSPNTLLFFQNSDQLRNVLDGNKPIYLRLMSCSVDFKVSSITSNENHPVHQIPLLPELWRRSAPSKTHCFRFLFKWCLRVDLNVRVVLRFASSSDALRVGLPAGCLR